MHAANQSLSERAGFYLAKGIYYYMSRKPDRLYEFAAKFNISDRLIKTCKICAALLVFFFVSDIHRYGAWYTGGSTYIKPYWLYAYILIWLPPAFAALKCVFTILEKYESMILWAPVLFIMLSAVFFIGTCIVCMADEGFYILSGYFFLRESQLQEILECSLVFSALLMVIIVISYIKERIYELLSVEREPEVEAELKDHCTNA